MLTELIKLKRQRWDLNPWFPVYKTGGVDQLAYSAMFVRRKEEQDFILPLNAIMDLITMSKPMDSNHFGFVGDKRGVTPNHRWLFYPPIYHYFFLRVVYWTLIIFWWKQESNLSNKPTIRLEVKWRWNYNIIKEPSPNPLWLELEKIRLHLRFAYIPPTIKGATITI